MVYLSTIENQQCVSWRLLPLILLEGVLALVILWRTMHQIWWKSHPRRVFFHAVLLASCILRSIFWFGFCNVNLFPVGAAFMWWSNSLLLLCIASIIFQWSTAVSAGRVTAQEMQQSKRFSILHPLVFLHSVHLVCSVGGAIDLMSRQYNSTDELRQYPSQSSGFLLSYHLVNMATVAIDMVMACYVAIQLRERLLSAAMSDEMKKKSVIQMTTLIMCLTASLALQLIMDIPVVILGSKSSWSMLSFQGFAVLKYYVPGLFLSIAFLYIMRRVEERDPARLVIMPSRSLVEFEECSSPCVWCEHHRRYNVNQNKWDVTFLASFSPCTVDSSFRSAHSSVHGNLSQDSISSRDSPDAQDQQPHPPPYHPPHPQRSRHHHHHHRLQNRHQQHHSEERRSGRLVIAPYS